MDAVTLLARQHEEMLRLLADLARQPTVSEHIQGGQLRRREQTLQRIGRCFVTQEGAKQRYLWPLLRRAWPDGAAIVAAARARKQQAEELLIKLRWLGDRDVQVNDATDALAAVLREHIAIESRHLGRLRRGVPAPDLAALGDKLAGPHLLPTRPHPDLPSSPLAVALLGPVVAVTDRVVDAFAFGPSGA
jgi:hypothetical protein